MKCCTGYWPRGWSTGAGRAKCASWAALTPWLTVCAVVLLSSCKTDTVLMRRGAPALITAAQGRLQLAAWDPATSSLAEVGWVDAADAVGLTVVEFDWSTAP